MMTLSDRRPLLANVNSSINSACKKMASKDRLFTDAEVEKGAAIFLILPCLVGAVRQLETLKVCGGSVPNACGQWDSPGTQDLT